MLAMVPATTNTVKRGLRTNDRSTKGYRTRFSTTMNRASRTSAPKKAAIVDADSHPQLGARSNVNVNNPIPKVTSARPATSIRRGTGSSDDSAMVDAPITSDRTVNGTFSQKIHRQPTVSVSRPPISGPAALPNPAMP